ncbi:MAG: Transcriptional regulator, MarR family [Candidatus Bipolaricaulis sibiricus]|uniref:Transcriptional regulator, MarR family n=1 Tax=Bipolaricaulis sibiricus TaxID=2501609 RepID=A0A410FTQ5_BIPS1|nr:MAG: Transcriptional regulator, MarR family [Candidatus Bipolaricaulis sibiricus]
MVAEQTGRADERLGHLLMQVSKLLRDRVHTRMEGIGLSRGQGFILFRLGHEDGLPQTELARQTMVRPATLTEVLQRMESAGLVERRPDPADGRVSRVFLTPQGEAARRQAEEIWRELEADLNAIMTAEERAALRVLLGKLRSALGTEAP